MLLILIDFTQKDNPTMNVLYLNNFNLLMDFIFIVLLHILSKVLNIKKSD
jgi:hypothetical protein